MDIAVPSRFACLKIEDEDSRPRNDNVKKTQEVKRTKRPTSTKGASQSASSTSVNASQRKTVAEKIKSAPSTKKQKKIQQSVDKNWEEWQKKDSKFVNDVFEEQMQSAILQSKLEFEQQKKTGPAKQEVEQSQGKKKKGKTMSLDQFLDKNNIESTKNNVKPKKPKDFFQEVYKGVSVILTNEQVEQNRKDRQDVVDDVMSLAQCQEKLDNERIKNVRLEKELEEAKKEIASVKKRNATLCSMLSQGEMKDKAQVLLELERLTTVKEELTEEVTNLHKLLEQERSNKISQTNQAESHGKYSKDKSKKKKH
ncbi:hypothetical protein ABEB36_012067 [Hypothenemus hampei]